MIARFLLLALGAAILLMAGCASRSLSEHQCLAGDWQTIGERDGANGLPTSQVLVHQNACGRHGVVPDSAGYRSGWATGIRRFCTAENGYELGLSGRANPNVCPQELTVVHQQAYFDGRELHLARERVQRLEAELSRKEARSETINREILASAAAQADPVLAPADRVALLERTSALLSEKETLERELPVLRSALDAAYDELDAIDSSVVSR